MEPSTLGAWSVFFLKHTAPGAVSPAPLAATGPSAEGGEGHVCAPPPHSSVSPLPVTGRAGLSQNPPRTDGRWRPERRRRGARASPSQEGGFLQPRKRRPSLPASSSWHTGFRLLNRLRLFVASRFTEERDWRSSPAVRVRLPQWTGRGGCSRQSGDDLGCARHRQGRWPWANCQQWPWPCRASQHSILFTKLRQQMGRGLWKRLPHIHVTVGTWLGKGKAARLMDVAPGAHAYCLVLTGSRNTVLQATHTTRTHTVYTHVSTLPVVHIVHVAEHLSLRFAVLTMQL